MLLISPKAVSLWAWLTGGCRGTHSAKKPGASVVPPSQRSCLGLEPPQLPGVLLFIHEHRCSPGFPGCPVMHPGFPVRWGCPGALRAPAA